MSSRADLEKIVVPASRQPHHGCIMINISLIHTNAAHIRQGGRNEYNTLIRKIIQASESRQEQLPTRAA